VTDRALAGMTALVTGAASGIGRATVLAFARAGARVVAADVDDEGGAATAEAARAVGGDVVAARCDVRSGADVDALVAGAVARFGRLDCAVNNAGIEGVLAPIGETDEAVAARVLDVNLMGVWRCLRAELPRMAAQPSRVGRQPGAAAQRGAIVNTASVAGLVGAGGLAPYVASKHGVVGLTKAAALEYATAGIRVNAVCPGVIQTPMVDRLAAARPGIVDALLAVKPMGRLGTPDEVAAAIVWLCSDAASFTTGHALTVDGGYVVP
jgi:NAD(P)-dependent dehydrogenase (short-subunit alcohol dehydrogenase family)